MKIPFRGQLFLYILGTFLMVNLAGYVASKSTLFAGYLHLEKEQALEHLERVQNTLDDDLADLARMTVDWAAWDDTYEFVVDKNTDYIKSNLVSSTFDELGLYVIVILDAEGKVAYSSAFDRTSEKQVALPPEFVKHLSPSSPLLNHAQLDSRFTGIVSMPQAPLLVTSSPIIRSDMNGPQRGVFIMGRLLGQEGIAGLIQQTNLAISLDVSPPDPGVDVAAYDITFLNEEEMAGYLEYRDIYGQGAFRLKIEIPRRISLQGQATLSKFFIWNLVATLLFSVIAYVLLDRWYSSRKERLASEERFRLIFASSSAGGCVLSDEGIIQQVNPAFVSLLGYAGDELVGRKFFELINPADRIWIVSHFDKRKKTNGSFSSRLSRADGKFVWAKGSIGWAGAFAILMVQDITDQKNTEASLRLDLRSAEKEKNETRAVLSSAGDGVLLIDRYNTLKMCNPAAENILEMHSSYMVNRSINMLIESEDLMSLITRVRKGDDAGSYCDVPIYRMSTEIPAMVRFSVAPVLDSNGDINNIVLTLNDLSADYERDQFKNDSIAIMAHEIRSPLTVVQGFAELLLYEHIEDAEERHKLISGIYEKSKSLSALVNDLMDMERVTSGRQVELNRTQVSIHELLSKIAWRFERTYDSHKFEIKLADDSPMLKIDEQEIERVVENLLSNAVKYSPVGSKIVVGSKVSGKEFRLNVEDNGVGMTADDLQRVFEKFYRSDATIEIAEGKGLGLTIAREIVEAHGGRIWLNSVYGEGTRAYISLPLMAQGEGQEHFQE